MQAVLFFRFINTFPYAAFMVFIPVLTATQYGFSATIAGVTIMVSFGTLALVYVHSSQRSPSLPC